MSVLPVTGYLQREGGNMSVRLKALADPVICETVTRLYMTTEFTSAEAVAASVGETAQTVRAILKANIPADTLRRKKVANYSHSKTGHKNPMFGVQKQVSAIFRSGYRYLWAGDQYAPEHRILVQNALGLPCWPEGWEVHHINGDKTDNRLDNLAVATHVGHRGLHGLKLQRLYLWEKEQFGTSLLKDAIATVLKD